MVVDLIPFVVTFFPQPYQNRPRTHMINHLPSVLLSHLCARKLHHLYFTKDCWSHLKSVAVSVCISQESHAHVAFRMLHFSPPPSFCSCPQDSHLKACSRQNLLWQLLSHNTNSLFPHSVPFFVCVDLSQYYSCPSNSGEIKSASTPPVLHTHTHHIVMV